MFPLVVSIEPPGIFCPLPHFIKIELSVAAKFLHVVNDFFPRMKNFTIGGQKEEKKLTNLGCSWSGPQLPIRW